MIPNAAFYKKDNKHFLFEAAAQVPPRAGEVSIDVAY